MMFQSLIKLANRLDLLGHYAEADRIDEMLKLAIEDWEYYGFSSPEQHREHKELKYPDFSPPEEVPTAPQIPEEKPDLPTEKETPLRSYEMYDDMRAIERYLGDLYQTLTRAGGGIKTIIGHNHHIGIIFKTGMDSRDDLEDAIDIYPVIRIYDKHIGHITLNGIPSDDSSTFHIAITADAKKDTDNPDLLYDYIEHIMKILMGTADD